MVLVRVSALSMTLKAISSDLGYGEKCKYHGSFSRIAVITSLKDLYDG
jgi:hypothetical protein